VNYKKGCTRLAAASDKVYQLLAHGRWFSLGTPASSSTKTGRHDIAESGVKTPKIKIKIKNHYLSYSGIIIYPTQILYMCTPTGGNNSIVVL
jgi:hypothetical protein